MKVIVIRDNLRNSLSVVDRTTIENQNLPILKNVLFSAENGKIVLTTTNLESAVRCIVSGKIIESGSITVPVGTLTSLVNNLPSERLNIEERDGGVEIKTDNYEATIRGLPTTDFPIIPEVKNIKKNITISTAAFLGAITQTIHCAQQTELRPELNSILLRFTTDHIKIVATDSFRLAEKTIPKTTFTTNHTEDFSILIPLKTANELTHALKEDETVQVSHDENQILFKTNRVEYISRLIEGTFPAYEHLVPKQFDAEATLNREEFLSALKLTSVFGSRTNEVRLRLDPNKKNMEIVSFDQPLGENKYVLAARTKGHIQETGFNWRYLTDGLRAEKTEEVFLGLNGENKPALLQSPGVPGYFYVLMPILKT